MIKKRPQTQKNVIKRSKTLTKRSKTVRNGHGNGQERWTVRDGERYETIILYKTNGLKRLQNNVHGTVTVRSRYGHVHVHVHVSKTKESLY
jgi:hypothetical protein